MWCLEDGKVFEQAHNADDDHDDLQDLLDAAFHRQALDQPENEDDDEEGNENTDESGHKRAPVTLGRLAAAQHNADRPGSVASRQVEA